MKITQAPAKFRPVSLILETQDDFDRFVAIVAGVARNRINHTPPVIRAAVNLLNLIQRDIEPTE